MRLTRQPTITAAFGILMLLSRGLSAQTAAPTPAPSDELRYPGWVFTPVLAVGGGWDDNILLVNPQNNPPRDYASPVNPGATIDFTGRRTEFSSSYNGSFTFYRTIDELTTFEHFFRASLQQRLTKRVTLFATENFARAPTTDALQVAGVPFYRIGSYTNRIGSALEARVNKFTTARVDYDLQTVSFDPDVVANRNFLGGHAHEVGMSLERKLSERLAVNARYDFTRGIIGQAVQTIDPFLLSSSVPTEPGPLGGVAPDRNFNIQSGDVGVAYRVSSELNVSGGAGVARMSGTLTEAAQVGPTFNAGANWRREHYFVTLKYERSFIPSFAFGGTFQNQELVGSLHVPFAKNRAYSNGNVAWYSSDPLTGNPPSLRSIWFSGKLGYRASRWLSVEGYFERSQQDSARAGGQRTRNQVGVQLVTSKPIKLQ